MPKSKIMLYSIHMNPSDLIKTSDIENTASQGKLIYESVKDKYEENNIGQFLAIDINSRDLYLAPTSSEAVIKAREVHPNKLFYVVKIGFDAAETLANMIHNRK